jgi:hypothetical protein
MPDKFLFPLMALAVIALVLISLVWPAGAKA